MKTTSIFKNILFLLPWPGEEGISISDLCEMLGSKRVWTTMLVATLLEQGYVGTYKTGKTHVFLITEKGKTYFRDTKAPYLTINYKPRISR